MSSDFHDPGEHGTDAQANSPAGLLQIELPHWTAGVRIYNSLLQRLPGNARVRKRSRRSQGYTSWRRRCQRASMR